MATYNSQSISNYNTNPPPDDGTASSDNEITWAKHKTKLADPIKTLAEAINTQLVTSFGTVDTELAKRLMETTADKSSTFTLGATDDGKVMRCTGTYTINMDAAATLGDGWKVVIFNEGSGTLTIDPNGSETINGATTLAITEQYGYAIISCDGTDLIAITAPSLLDEDDMASDSDTQGATQQSIKAYIDGLVGAKGLQTFTSSGTYTPTSGTTSAIAIAVGGGGGGGGVAPASTGLEAAAGGGGAGEVSIGFFAVSGTKSVTVGAAGTAGSSGGGNGGAGGQSSVAGVVVANGGSGGTGSGAAAADSTISAGGNGGTGGGTGFSMVGGDGGNGSTGNDSARGGMGGTPSFGGGGGRGGVGGYAGATQLAASSGNGYGGGGGGAAASTGTGTAGGAGSGGMVLIIEF